MNLIQSVIDLFNNHYAGALPSQVARDTLIACIAAYIAYRLLQRIKAKGLKGALLGYALAAVKFVPGASTYTDKIKLQLREQLVPDYVKKLPVNYTLPEKGVDSDELLATLSKWSKQEIDIWGEGKASGAIYHGDLNTLKVATQAYSLFALSNPLHPELFPYVRKLESEVIRMTANLFQGTMTQCGVMTSGGTESILMSIKTYRDQARAERGVTQPELIVPSTAHAAFDKACGYFNIKQVIVPVNPLTQRADPNEMKKCINPNTIALVGSAPTFPHGVIDPIPELSTIAKENKIGLHVDCCLGSYLIPFARILGYPIPKFDFSLEGVTSISVDTHKYGYSPKGSSVLLFRDEALRKYMYYVSIGSPLGIYASPTIAGSRPGAIVASTWATVMSFGYDGYRSHAEGILTAADSLRQQINTNALLNVDPASGKVIPSANDLIVVGDSKLSVVSFGIRHQVEKMYKNHTPTPNVNGEPLLDIYAINAALSKTSHWHLNTLQNPSCVHLCVTWANHQNAINIFMSDLYNAIAQVKANPAQYAQNTHTQLYGVAEAINIDEDANNQMDVNEQDQNTRKNNLVGEMAIAYIDTLTWLPTPEEDKAYKLSIAQQK